MTQSAVLCIGAGPLQVPLLLEAKQMGLYVIAVDGNIEAIGRSIADRFVNLDIYAKREIQSWVALWQRDVPPGGQGHPIIGVVTAGADVAPTVAIAAATARVRGIPILVAERSHNKAVVRATVAEKINGYYQPRWIHHMPGNKYTETFYKVIESTIGYPCVLKPLEQRASRGITILRQPDDLDFAVRKVLQYGDEYLVEECMTGSEHSVESMLVEGRPIWFNVVDRRFHYEHGIPLETGHVNPSKLSSLQTLRLRIMLITIAHCLGVCWGPFKMDIMWTPDGPRLLEATCRLSGGWDCQGTSPLTGRHPLRMLLQMSCGLDTIEDIPTANGYAACAAILPKQHGTIHALPGNDILPQAPSADTTIHEILWAAKVGDVLAPITHCAQRPGFVLSWANTYEHAWRGAKEAADTLADHIVIRNE